MVLIQFVHVTWKWQELRWINFVAFIFSERIAQNWIKGKTSYTSRTVSSTYTATTTTTVEWREAREFFILPMYEDIMSFDVRLLLHQEEIIPKCLYVILGIFSFALFTLFLYFLYFIISKTFIKWMWCHHEYAMLFVLNHEQ